VTILDQIVETKKIEVAALRDQRPDLDLPGHRNRSYRFLNAIQSPGLSIIAEIKKASPSRGIIRHDFDPLLIANHFKDSGAAALSILTDGPYFQGSPLYIPQVKHAVDLPILRKEFIIDPIQIRESVELGADAILLIKAILTRAECQHLLNYAHESGLDVLIEVHNRQELSEVLQLTDLDMIGINNRNLKTFETDIQLSTLLKPIISDRHPTLPVVAESGYSSVDQLRTLSSQGFAGALIGEGLAVNPALMSQLSRF